MTYTVYARRITALLCSPIIFLKKMELKLMTGRISTFMRFIFLFIYSGYERIVIKWIDMYNMLIKWQVTPICRFYFSNSSYVVSNTSLIALSCDACMCWIPLSIFTNASLVNGTFFNCINATISVCRIPFSFLICLMFRPINISSCFIFCSISSPHFWTRFGSF